MKSKHKSNYSFLLDLTEPDEQNREVKFDLFVQLRKVKQIMQALDQAVLSDHQLDAEWVAQNQELIDVLLNELLDDSMLVLDGVQLDDEGIDMSLDLMQDIRHTLDLVQQIVDESDGVEN